MLLFSPFIFLEWVMGNAAKWHHSSSLSSRAKCGPNRISAHYRDEQTGREGEEIDLMERPKHSRTHCKNSLKLQYITSHPSTKCSTMARRKSLSCIITFEEEEEEEAMEWDAFPPTRPQSPKYFSPSPKSKWHTRVRSYITRRYTTEKSWCV